MCGLRQTSLRLETVTAVEAAKSYILRRVMMGSANNNKMILNLFHKENEFSITECIVF